VSGHAGPCPENCDCRPVYLAARYSRRAELTGYAEELRSRGITVRADWLKGEHDSLDGMVTDAGQAAWATIDRSDIDACGMFVAFTEEPRSGHSRGGRHVELGMALARGKAVTVIGPRENVFCWLPEIGWFPSWSAFLEIL